MVVANFAALLAQLQEVHEDELQVLREELSEHRRQSLSPPLPADTGAYAIVMPAHTRVDIDAGCRDGGFGSIAPTEAVRARPPSHKRGKEKFSLDRLCSLGTLDKELPGESAWSRDVKKVDQHLRRSLHKNCLPCLDCLEHCWLTQEPKRSGLLVDLVSSRCFQGLVGGVIIANTVFIAVNTDVAVRQAFTDAHSGQPGTRAKDSLLSPYKMTESFFTLFYLLELIARFAVHRLYFLKGEYWTWNLLDICVVCISTADWFIDYFQPNLQNNAPSSGFVRLLRALRVAKVLRIFRAVRFLTQLRLMMECVVSCLTALSWCLMLIGFFLFLFALAFVQGITSYLLDASATTNALELEKMERAFGGVQHGIVSLFMATTGGLDWDYIYRMIGKSGSYMNLLFLFFIGFFHIAFWNILTSVFVERALKLAMSDKDSLIKDKRLQDIRYAREMAEMLDEKLDNNHDGLITKQEFTQFMEDGDFPELVEFLSVRGLDLRDAVFFFNMLLSVSEHEDAVDIHTFVGGCLRLQGLATSLDLMSYQFELKGILETQSHALHDSLSLLETLKLDFLISSPAKETKILDPRQHIQAILPANGTVESSKVGKNPDLYLKL